MEEIFVKVADKVIAVEVERQDQYEFYSRQLELMRIKGKVEKVDYYYRVEGEKLSIFSFQKFVIEKLKGDYLFFHGAGLERAGNAILFIGPAGSGKTTAFIYGLLSGYNGLSDEFLLYSPKNKFIYPLPFNVKDYKISFQIRSLLGREIPFNYSLKARINRVYLLGKERGSEVEKLNFLFKNCFNSYLEKIETYIRLVEFVNGANSQISFIPPLNIFEDSTTTRCILDSIFKGHY